MWFSLYILIAIIALIAWNVRGRIRTAFYLTRQLKGPKISEIKKFSNVVDALKAWSIQYGSTFRVFFGPICVMVSSKPEVFKQTLNGDRAKWNVGPRMYLRRAVGNSLPTSNGKDWKHQRQMLNPAFGFHKVAEMTAIFDKCLAIFFQICEEKIRTGEPINLTQALTNLSTDIIALSAFGMDLKAQSNTPSAALAHLHSMQKISPVVVMLSNYLPEIFFPVLRKQNQLHKEMRAELAKVINERRELAKTTAPELLPLDLLSLIVNARDEQGNAMSLEEIINQALGIFNSYETTSTAMSWAIYEMLVNPVVEEKLHGELTKHKDILSNRAPTAEELREFSYLGMVVDEVLRKYSIIPIVDRIATTDTTLDGMFVPQGTLLLLFPYGVHQNEEHWPKPNEFRPERHAESSTEPKRAPMAMMPFSFGQRNCIGKEFAVLQMQSLLSQILIRYKFTFVPNHPPVGLGYASSVNKPNIDIMLNVHPRSHTSTTSTTPSPSTVS